MEKFFGRSTILVTLWLIACSSAFAYEFSSPPYRDLAAKLQVEPITPALCEEIHKAYLALPRSCPDQECRHRLAEDVYEMKILISSWRLWTKTRILNQIITGKVKGKSLVEALDALRLTRIQIHADEMKMLDGVLPGYTDPFPVRRAMNLLFAEQGELSEMRRELLRGANAEVLRAAGPLIYPDMRAELRPEVPMPEWARTVDYSMYQDLTDHSVTFRGIRFQAGDLIIVDEARPVAGFMPSLFAPRQMMNHFAYLAIANFEGRLVPIVYDLADTFRIIPLNLFLSERFCTNAFVLRHREMTVELARRAEKTAFEVFQYRPPFNMEAEEGKDIAEGLTCGTFALHLLSKLGLTLPTERSVATNPRLISNLDKVKYSRRQIFSPINMFQSSQVKLVGAIDNGQLGKVIVRSFVNRQYAELMQTKDLDVDSLPGDFSRLVYAVGRMQERSILGTVFRTIFAYEHTSHSFARGNPFTIALYHHWHTALSTGETTNFLSLCPRALLGASQPSLFSIHDFESSDGGVQRELAANLEPVAVYFKTPAP